MMLPLKGGAPSRKPTQHSHTKTALTASVFTLGVFCMLRGFWMPAPPAGMPSAHQTLEEAGTDVWMSSASRARLHQVPMPGPPIKAVPLVPEVWARGPANTSSSAIAAVRAQLDASSIQRLQQLCARSLYRTLTSYVKVQQMGRFAIVLTGDIPAVWLRDSTVQMASYFPRMHKHPAIRNILEGALRAQAFFLLQDPWANAYNPAWKDVARLPKGDRILGRGGWVWTRNFELDSLAYFLMYLWNYWTSPGLYRPESLLMEPLVHDAVVTVLKVLEIEQHHEERSPYRYSELPRDGLGPPTKYTGMVWSAFRASDDQQKYSYHIPDNMYLVGALQRLRVINAATWRSSYISITAARLVEEVSRGIEQHGIVQLQDGSQVYAYEVDGLGNSLVDFDDPNIPSLLAIPELGYDGYDKEVYATTMSRVYSRANKYYFSGSALTGLGSPHTPANYVWPLATAMEALTSTNATRQAGLLKDLLLMAQGNGLVHESVDVNQPDAYTRPEFGWANAMAAVAIEQLLGVDCDQAAELQRLEQVMEREKRQPSSAPNGGKDLTSYYELLEAHIQYQ